MQKDSGPVPPPNPPVVIPDHTLLRCIGRGSYGEVWLARNMMGVYRAVKIVYRNSFQDERPFQRELSGIRKFEPISRSHEGFVDVLQVGINEPQGYFYYVMELGDDQAAGQHIDPESYSPKTLAKELLSRWRLSFQECLKLGLALSQALAELHKHDLVHRDVKPSNIIFVNGVPKLADIGLVAGVSEARSYVGTEGFIPPEGPGAPQADVFGLGKVLYEASTGKDRQEFPELPTRFEKFPDHDSFLELNEVIVHACRNEMSERYPSAWDLHADLLVLANGKSVKRLKLLERRLFRLKRIAGMAALVGIALMAIGYQVYRERRAVVESRQRQVGANVAYGNRAVEAGDLLGALPRIWFAKKQVEQGQFSPDGSKVLFAKYFDKAEIYDLQTGIPQVRPFGQANGLTSAAFSQDGRFVVTASEDRTACLWDLATLEPGVPLTHPQQVLSARFSPDGFRVVTACHDGVARVWDVRTHVLKLSLSEAQGLDATKGLRFASFSHDGHLIVTTGEDNTARIWDGINGRLTALLEHPGPGDWVTYAAFSPDDQKLVTACTDHKAYVWEIGKGFTKARRIMPDLTHGDAVTSAEFSPDGRLIVTASLDGTARLWLADTLQPVGTNPILRHGERVTHASFSPDSRLIITTCTDGVVRIWDRSVAPPVSAPYSFNRDGSRFLMITNDCIEVRDASSGKAISPLIRLKTSAINAQLNRNGRFIIISSMLRTNRVLQVWDVATGQPIAPGISVLNSACAGYTLSDDGKRLVTYGMHFAQCWDVVAGASVPLALEGNDPVGSACFSPDGNRVAIRRGKQIQTWHAVSGRPCSKPLEHSSPVQYAEFSPDGNRLVSCCSDDQYTKCYAQVWNVATGLPASPPLKHGDGVLFASFSPDSTRVVTASEDFTALVWDAITGKQLTPPLKHEYWVRTATFSPDGKWILTASSDKTARVWNAENGDPLTPPLRHLAGLTAARFLADGRGLVTTDEQGKAWLWSLPIEEKPVDDLVMLGRLLSGNTIAPAGQLTPPRSETLETIWQRLGTKYPSDFAVSREEITAWHQHQAEDCEMQRQWFAAAFHLERLLAIRNGDQSLADHLARVKEHLQKE